jgi:hypothetical protein
MDGTGEVVATTGPDDTRASTAEKWTTTGPPQSQFTTAEGEEAITLSTQDMARHARVARRANGQNGHGPFQVTFILAN